MSSEVTGAFFIFGRQGGHAIIEAILFTLQIGLDAIRPNFFNIATTPVGRSSTSSITTILIPRRAAKSGRGPCEFLSLVKVSNYAVVP